MTNSMAWKEWLAEAKRLAVSKYEFTPVMADQRITFVSFWGMFANGRTPEEALKEYQDSE